MHVSTNIIIIDCTGIVHLSTIIVIDCTGIVHLSTIIIVIDCTGIVHLSTIIIGCSGAVHFSISFEGACLAAMMMLYFAVQDCSDWSFCGGSLVCYDNSGAHHETIA